MDELVLRRQQVGAAGFGQILDVQQIAKKLGEEAADYLATLPPNRLLEDGVVLVHGGVRDVQQYMVTPAHINRELDDRFRLLSGGSRTAVPRPDSSYPAMVSWCGRSAG